MARRLGRRTFLVGTGSVAVALPLLEIMADSKSAASPGDGAPCRYLMAFAGTSLPRNGLFVPAETGAGYTLPRALRPLTGPVFTSGSYESVRDRVNVVSGLHIPDDASVPGGRAEGAASFHSATMSPLLTGVRSRSSDPTARGKSSDQVVADRFMGSTAEHSLQYRVQPDKYRDVDGLGPNDGVISYRGDAQPISPIVSPRVAYNELFSGFMPGSDPGDETALRLVEQDRSVLDLVRANTQDLMRRVGRQDRERLERHFEEIRALERRVATTPDPTMSSCMPPDEVPSDPSIDPRGWADETARGLLLADLIHMAFVCDITRVASLVYTFSQSFMSVEHILGLETDLHEVGHGAGSNEDVADGVAWHVEMFSYLVSKLASTPEGSGTVLDHCALGLTFEGGVLESVSTWGPHTSDHMCMLVAGGAGGLRGGEHIGLARKHPAAVLVSMMNAVGVEGGTLGEITDSVPELFV